MRIFLEHTILVLGVNSTLARIPAARLVNDCVGMVTNEM